jgi:hypothetical protein
MEKQYVLHYECVYVALVIQYAQCHLWPLWLYNIFPHSLFKWHEFWEKIY